jgi:hypothetical protein
VTNPACAASCSAASSSNSSSGRPSSSRSTSRTRWASGSAPGAGPRPSVSSVPAGASRWWCRPSLSTARAGPEGGRVRRRLNSTPVTHRHRGYLSYSAVWPPPAATPEGAQPRHVTGNRFLNAESVHVIDMEAS